MKKSTDFLFIPIKWRQIRSFPNHPYTTHRPFPLALINSETSPKRCAWILIDPHPQINLSRGNRNPPLSATHCHATLLLAERWRLHCWVIDRPVHCGGRAVDVALSRGRKIRGNSDVLCDGKLLMPPLRLCSPYEAYFAGWSFRGFGFYCWARDVTSSISIFFC